MAEKGEKTDKDKDQQTQKEDKEDEKNKLKNDKENNFLSFVSPFSLFKKNNKKEEKNEKDTSKEENNGKNKAEKSDKEKNDKGQSKTKSIGFPARKTSSLESEPIFKYSHETDSALVPLGGLPAEYYGEYVYDSLAFIIYCPTHKKIALTKSRNKKASWLPFVALRMSETYDSTSTAGISYILSHGMTADFVKLSKLPFLSPEVIHILRLQANKDSKYFTRVTLAVRINHEVKEWKCCTEDRTVNWYDKDDVIAGKIENLWGPEPKLFAERASQEQITKRDIAEYSASDALRFAPQEQLRNKEEALLKNARFAEKEIIHVYKDFMAHCFPSQFMTLYSFQALLARNGLTVTDSRLSAYFRAFNYAGNGYLSFHEILLGLAAMDPNTEHDGDSGELRCAYIFRYFDVNSDNLLDFSDMKRMMEEIHRVKKETTDDKTVEKEATDRMQQMKMKTTDTITFPQFMKGVADKIIRGTSMLFRADKPIVQHAVSRNIGEIVAETTIAEAPPQLVKMKYRGTCQPCKQKTFRLTGFSVQFDYSGRVIDPQPMTETEGKDLDWKTNDPLIEELRKFSRETVFNPKFIGNTLLDILRPFNEIQKKRISKSKPEIKPWMKQEKTDMFNALQQLCKKAEEILEREPRCVQVSSPVFVFGDTHGNIADVLTYERNVWRGAPAVCPTNVLFLGDYVDRGEHGVEVVAYLLSMKVLAPDKFFLCRGNHEIRSIQKTYTFYKECKGKFGTRMGPQVFEACNRTFDRMPICAVIDDSIFGAHGGIPTSLSKIDEVNRLPAVVQEPENEAPAAWEMVWSDPMNKAEFVELAEFMKVKSTQGFLSNSKRGTAFYYSDEAVNNFLTNNGLQYVLRGHEVFPLGYKLHLNGKVTTIFSSSHYCNGSNEAAAMYCDSDSMRVIRFENHGSLNDSE